MGSGSWRGGGGGVGDAQEGTGRRLQGEVDVERRPLTRGRVPAERPARLGNDSIGAGEAQAETPAGLPPAIERVEQVPFFGRADPSAVVLDRPCQRIVGAVDGE